MRASGLSSAHWRVIMAYSLCIMANSSCSLSAGCSRWMNTNFRSTASPICTSTAGQPHTAVQHQDEEAQHAKATTAAVRVILSMCLPSLQPRSHATRYAVQQDCCMPCSCAICMHQSIGSRHGLQSWRDEAAAASEMAQLHELDTKYVREVSEDSCSACQLTV